MSSIKRRANEAFKRGDIAQAIELYSEALTSSKFGALPTEEKRAILANRAQAYLKKEDYFTALADCDRALSSEYTHDDAPMTLTVKCHWRRALALYKMCMYEDALNAYRDFDRLTNNSSIPVPLQGKVLLTDLGAGLATLNVHDDEQSENIKLLRAVQRRGIIIPANHRSNFPYTPEEKSNPRFDPGRAGSITGFNRFSIPQPNSEAPIEVPFSVIAPCCPDPRRPNRYFRCKLVMEEDETVGLYLDNLFTSAGLEHMGPENIVREYMFQAIDHQDPQTSRIFLVTYRDRILEIPRSTVIKDMWAGAKWPREGPLPFKEWSKNPRPRPHEVDGATMRNGNSMVLTVVPNEHMQH